MSYPTVKGSHVPGTPEYEERTAQEADDARRRKLHEQSIERAAWANLKRIYERCVSIAEDVWSEKLEAAREQQQDVAETMRDFGIPVPLFTNRDREQFLKEVSTTLLISADRRNLTAFYKEAPSDAPKADEGVGTHEAASGADETDAEAAALADAGPQ